MYSVQGLSDLPRQLVAAVPSRILSPVRKAQINQWLLRTFPATPDGASRLLISLTALVSLLATFAVHALAYPMNIATGVTLMWFVHETGHVVAARMLGLAVHAVWFIPFVGVIMLMSQSALLRQQRKEAIIGIAGPLSGLLGSALALGALYLFKGRLGTEVVSAAAFLILLSVAYNVFQLMLTVRPFDGGRVTQIVHPGFRFVALVLVLLVTFLWPKSWLIVIWALLLTDLRFFFQWRRLWLTAVLLGALLVGILTGNGRDVWWWNGADIFLLLLTLKWAYQQAQKDRNSWRKLPEWQALLSIEKHLFGSWKAREGDRRHEGERRHKVRGDDRRNGDDPRRLRLMPIDLRHEGGAFVDRRTHEHDARVCRTERTVWLIVYLSTLLAHLAIGWFALGMYQQHF